MSRITKFAIFGICFAAITSAIKFVDAALGYEHPMGWPPFIHNQMYFFQGVIFLMFLRWALRKKEDDDDDS